MVPRLRFPEYSDNGDWKNYNFYDLLEEILDFRGRTPLKLGMDWGGGNIISLSANNVKNGYIDYNAECNLGSEALYEKWMGKAKLQKGDIIFTMEAPLGNALLLPDDQKYILSQRVVSFRTKNNVVNSFLIQLIWNVQFQNQIEKLSTGSTAKGINQKNLQAVNVLIPNKKEEQQKIASCLSSLDELITAHSQKLEALKAHKKGLMQQLFPAEGETVPKLRFGEFRESGEWEEKVLGQIGEVLMCKRIFAEETNENSGIPFYKIGTLGGKPDAFISKELFNEYKSKYNYPRKGEILITCSGTIGKCLPFNGEDSYYQDSNIVWIDNPTLEICNELLFYWLSNVNWGQLNSTTITRIYGSDLRNLKILFPKLPAEQQKIATCLSSLDELISAQGQKIEALKAHKKGLMQGLFPNVNDTEKIQ